MVSRQGGGRFAWCAVAWAAVVAAFPAFVAPAVACQNELPWARVVETWKGPALVGRIYATRQEPAADGPCGDRPGFGMASRAEAVLAGGGMLLLGEVHDNGEQHRFRAALLEAWAVSDAVRRPGAVFEHIRSDQQPGLDEFKRFNAEARRLGHSGDLFRLLEWDKGGWPDKKLFAPLFDAAIRARLAIYAGDPVRADIKKIAKEGVAALPEADRLRLRLDQQLPAAAHETLLDDLEKSHCGLMPKTAFGNLATAQRFRDAHLADVVLKAADENGSAILFAGNGHVRADRGVPHYLRQRAADKTVVTVLLLEVEDGKTEPEAYVERDADGKPIADYIVFTPRAERPDPCEEMKKAFGRKKD